ncbi:response regulator [Bdellovibrio sp. HCB209]|uniref:response regulator n=1 Tax=Bdellovibrio sp. HCB209 TaxID=3394354 RepID=UPI0039B5C940
MKNNESLELKIRKVDLLLGQSFTAMIAVLTTAYFYTFIAWDTLSHKFLIIWFLTINIYAALSLGIVPFWKEAKDRIQRSEQLKPWLRAKYSLLCVSGACWAAMGYVAPWSGTAVQNLSAMLAAVMTAGGIILYVSNRIAMFCVVAPTILGWAAGYIVSEQPHHYLVGGVMMIYLGLVFGIGRSLNKSLTTLFTMDRKLLRSEERVSLAMASSEAMTWDWDLQQDIIFREGNLALLSEQALLKDILKSHFHEHRELDFEFILASEKGGAKSLAFRGKIERDEAGEVIRATGILWDVTIKKNQEFLRRERDLHEAANDAKSVLLANASHEIRTPLAAIIGFSDAMLTNPNLDEQAYRDTLSIQRQGKFMTSLVNDLLDLSKIESKKLLLQKVPMSPVREIEDSVSVIRTVLDKRHRIFLSFASLLPEEIQMDSVRFRQVLINLLSNAVKFTPQGEIHVAVSFGMDTDNQGTLRILVSDSGIGMNKQTQMNLFQPFMRGESREVQSVVGSGLGLALSQRLARLSGGDLRLIESVEGKGSTFEYSVRVGSVTPLRLIEAHQANRNIVELSREGLRSSEFLKNRRILVVDDSEDLRNLMDRHLQRHGAVVDVCDSGQLALEKVLRSENGYDVILMDIKMPQMSGHQATAALREAGYRRPIIALTAQASTEGQRECMKSGFDGYLSKPVDIAMLEEELTRVLTVTVTV